MNCPECGTVCERNWKYCPKCSSSLPEVQRSIPLTPPIMQHPHKVVDASAPPLSKNTCLRTNSPENMQCPFCHKAISPEWKFCPSCTKPLSPVISAKKKTKRNRWGWLIPLGIVLILAFAMFGNHTANEKDSQAIKKATALLADSFDENKDIAKANWGKLTEAKNALAVVTKHSESRQAADSLLAEIKFREYGKVITDSLALMSNKDLDFSKLKDARRSLATIPADHKYYSSAQETLKLITEKVSALALEQAKESMKKGSVNEAKNFLYDIDSKSSSNDEGSVIMNRINDIEAQSRNIAESIIRTQYAKNLEDIFIKQGMDVYVSVTGENSEYLSMKYILWSRPLVYKFANEGKVIENARKMGFKKVTFDTGSSYRESWFYDL